MLKAPTKVVARALALAIAVVGTLALPAQAASSSTECRGMKVTIAGTKRSDTIKGTSGVDVIRTFRGDDRISGLGGNDVICGNRGKDTISGGTGVDRIFGGRAADVLAGDERYDEIYGGFSTLDTCNDDYFNAFLDCELGGGADPDDDEMVNAGEEFWGTDPHNPDSDGDGYKDGEEIQMEGYPTDPCSPYRDSPTCDRDHDGLTNSEEQQQGSDPQDSCSPDPTSAYCDSDGDNLGYEEETNYGTDPEKADTDDDGMNDYDEVDAGYDPLDPCDPYWCDQPV